MNTANAHEKWMREALIEATKASRKDEVPIGAIAIFNDAVVGRAHNMRESTQNPIGHAEILLIDQLAKTRKSWRLDEITIYVTCEPCLMCAGAILQARIPKVVYGCPDPKAGAMGSLYDVSSDFRMNHQIEVVHGVLSQECGQVLSDFFKRLRV